MKIAVFGANGQLGRSMRFISDNFPQHNFIFTDIDKLDIRSYDQISSFVSNNYPHVFINCAAYTAVDKAEGDKKAAKDLNANAVDNMAKIAAEHNIFLVHVSTDYIYDGKQNRPYRETDNVHPISMYGRTKWKGEVAIMKSLCRAAIIRTSWLYSEYGTNFVKTMFQLGATENELKIVFDQIGTPTYARDLAKAIMQIVNQMEKVKTVEVFHYSNEGIASWYDVAVEIMQQGKRKCKVLPILTQQYPTPAKRPLYAVLDKQKIKQTFDIEIPHWRDSLKQCMVYLGTSHI